MVRYEIALILRSLPKDKLKDAFRTAATVMLEEGALVRGMKHLGSRQLPYRMKAHKKWFEKGSYLVCDVEASPQMGSLIVEKLRDADVVIKASISKLQET